MAIQKPNGRRLLNKDEEDERKASGKFFLPTLEELTAIEEKAKEDAAAAVSSQMADPMRNRNDLGRVAMQSAKQEMLAEHENAVNEQKRKVERAKQEYEAYPLIDRVGLGPSSLMADIARDNIKKQENEYDRMTMTEPEYAKKHKADFGELVEQIVQSAGYGAAKSFGRAVDVISATGAGLKSAGKWLGGEGDDESSAAKEFARGFQNRLADTEKSLYDEIDAEYQRERQRNAKVNGELNVFTGYIEQAAHSFGEQALMYWTASMSSALFGGAKVFSAISSKADDLAKSGKKGMQMLGQALGKINAGSVGGATSMLITSSAQSTKEAILDMRQRNEAAAAYGMPKKYTDDEIMEKSALFGFLNGLSEVGLEYAIGGITGAAGGILPKGKVKNPILTAALSYLKGGAGEGFEESVQTLASTGLKRAVYDQTAEVDWREVLDSGIVGALTGFGMGAPAYIRNTSLGVSAMRDVTNTAKATNRVNTDAQAGIVASASAAKAKAYGQMAEQVRNTDSENADTVASIYEWAAGRQQEIADAMADDTKRKQIIEENAKKSAEDTQAAIQRMRDTNPDFAEIERTGLASGAKVEDIRMAGDLSSVLGKKIRFFSEDAKNGTINNGEYHEDTGEIWINARSRNVKAQIVAHELTHSIEKKDSYQQLVDLTMNKLEAEQKAKGKTLDDLYREKETLYADGGVRLASYDEITSELVAEFVEKRLLTDEASIKTLVSENRTLGQRIREWFDSLLAKMGNASAKEREYIRQMRDMYARALGEDMSAETSADGKVRHSFVGESANIDKSQLAVAKQMEVDGKTDEEIYAETGWYKQSDGKWRMEIMDEIAGPGNFSRDGHDTKKSEKEIRDFAEAEKIEAEAKAAYESGEFTQEMYDHSMRYAASFREDHQNKGKLTKYLNAPKLFNAYPALENVTLEFRDLPDQVLGWSFSELNEIFIDDKQIEKYGQSLEEVLAHEIQHFIQDMEGFEQGTNPEAAGSEEDYYNAGGEIEARDVMDRLRMTEEERRGKMPVRFSISASEIDGSPIDAERISSEEGDVRYSITYAPQIEESQKEYIDKHKNVNVTDRELEEAHRVTEAMVDVMMKYSDILPEDKIGKVLTKNGSYDRSVENTTICVRTLAYNEFVDRVQGQIGRPLTQMESFLVSQKLYDIATDPQCMYCYVSLDRKSYNEMLLRYMQDRDTVIDKYNKSDKTPAAVESLYEEFLAGRKDTKNMRDRFNKWISYADNGTKLLSMADIATEARQTEIRAKGDQLADQLKDARAYAQSASWSKIQKDYVAYRDEILKLGDRVVKDLNEHYGMRWYSFSDYSAAFIVENMQQITDAAIRGLKGLSYTKDTDFAKIFAPSGMNINISVFVKQDKNGNCYIDDRQSANFEEALALREEYPNVGIVATVTDDGALRWAGEQEWSDVIIPFHIVRTGTDVASFYKWLNYTAESGDTIKDQNLWEAYVDSLNPKTEAARKKVSKNVYPSEHHNDKETYLNLCESRGLTPRFARFAGEDWYMKLVNETRRSADETPAMKPVFNEAAAKESFAKFVDKGGYSGGWYREDVDVDAEAKAVAADVLAGKKADEVSYGRQDVDAGSLMAHRKSVRSHGVKRISQNVGNVKGGNAGNTPHSISKVDDQRYKEAVDRGDMETAQKMVDEAARAAGWIPVTRYHQTGAQFTRFSNENPDAGLNDSDTPNGFFFKENDHDIGVGGDYVKTGHGGEIQMPVYLKTENVLSFKNRDEARSWYTKNVPGYMELLKKYEEYQAEYKRLDNENTGKMFEELELLDESGEYTASKADAVMKKYDAVIDDWIEKTKDYETGLRSEMRKLLNDFFLNGKSEYDAIELEDDGHRYIDGKREDVHTYIVFKNTQIKSSKPVTYDDNGNVIPLSERFKRDNDDIRHSVTREDASVTEAETDQTLQQIRNDIAADEARYRELSDTVMSNERFNAMMPDEQNAILDEMQSLRERIDRANQIMQDMSYEQDMGDDVPVPTDGDVPAEDDSYHGMKSMRDAGEDTPMPTDEDAPEWVKRSRQLKEMPDAGDDVPMPADGDAHVQEKQREGLTAEKAAERVSDRQKKRGERKTVAKAETAFKRLGYDIAGAIVDNYEDAAGIIEDDKIASQVESDINKYVKDNNIQFYVDNTAKLLALGQLKPENIGLRGEDLKHAKLLADMYRQFEEVSGNSIREQGKRNTNIVNEELDDIFRGYDWFTEPDKKQKRLREQMQLSLANPEQVMRDVFGDAKIVKDEDGNERLLNVAERLNEYIIRPTIENSARARRQTNQMVSGLRDLGLTKAESGITQIFAEYSDTEESKSKKPTISESDLRYMLMTKMDADGFAEQIARKEYGEKETEEKKEFRDSIVEQLQNEINVNEAKARQRALRDHKAKGGTNASWNALSETERNAKIDAAYKTVTDESIGRIVNGSKELRKLLDDMYEAINAVSVIHGAAPIPFRKGYMPHSHRQTEELQKWFNDHMGGLNVTPVQDLPTDIAGKTADRKPNKRWFSHAQQRTGPRTTWDALGNIEDYLRIANDTIYHMDDIRKMRVLERYIRGIYSVARGATGEEQRTSVKNDVMQRLHGEEVDLVFLGLQPPEKKQKISDEDMDLSQMTTFVTWLTNYANDLAAKQIFNRDIESFAGRKVNNLANTLTSWSSRTMMQYNISSNLKQLSQLGTVSGDVGAAISKDAAVMTLRSMQNLGNGTNELEQKYHISERSTFLAEKEAIEEATFASDKDLTEKQKSQQQHAKDIWDYAWSMTDTTMSRYAVYAYFMEGMQRGMDDTAALHYADTKARNILASRMKGSSPLIFQSKNPILRMFTLFQREPLAAWQDILKTMPREYSEMKTVQGEKTAKEQITKRITGRLLGAGIVNTVYATVLGLGTPAMFDIFGEPLRALIDKLWKDITPDEEDDITFKEMAERYISTLGDEIADDIPFANVVSLISNTYAGTEFESRLALNAPDLRKVFGLLGLGGKAAWNGAQLLWSDDAEDIELLEELSTIPGQIPVALLDMITEIVGTAAPAGNQIRKSAKGLIAVLRSGEYTKDGKLKYEVGGVGDSIRAVLLGSSNTRAGQEWIASGFDSLSKTETEAYKALIGAGVSEKRARQYVERVAEAEKVADETQAQAEARMIDGMRDLTKAQKAELYYDMVATDNQREAVDAAVGAGAKIDDAVETARAIRDSSKKLDRLTALQASDMDTDAREEMYLAMVATKVKDADGNVIGTEDDDTLEALYTTGLDFDDFLDAKQMQSVLNANESLTANQRASRFLAWTASQGYTDAQAEAIGENFGFSSGFRVKSETYQKIVDSGVTAENAVKVTDAIAGKTKTADKINAVWSTGLSGDQLDLAVKSVLSEKAYERYRIVVDANIPLEIYTWALLNADQDAEGEKGHGSVNNTERELILSQLALPRKDLSALWLALGGSEKSNPYSGTPKVTVPKVEVPKIEMPKIELPKIGG